MPGILHHEQERPIPKHPPTWDERLVSEHCQRRTWSYPPNAWPPGREARTRPSAISGGVVPLKRTFGRGHLPQSITPLMGCYRIEGTTLRRIKALGSAKRRSAQVELGSERLTDLVWAVLFGK